MITPLLAASYAKAAPPGMPTQEDINKEFQREDQMMREGEKKAEEAPRPIPPFKMLSIKGGCYDMGDFSTDGDADERPVHQVCLTDFAISETEVTQELFEAVMGYNPSKVKNPQMPVQNVSWIVANVFLGRLNARQKAYYRLPTEAEWEYAAREGGKKIKWAGTNNEGELGDYAWFSDNSDEEMHPVKQKKPNALGLYDMAGNIWEWTEDYFDFEYYQVSPKQDPLGPDMSFWRVLRGGSAVEPPLKIRNTYRYALEQNRRLQNVGFRIAE